MQSETVQLNNRRRAIQIVNALQDYRNKFLPRLARLASALFRENASGPYLWNEFYACALLIDCSIRVERKPE